MRTGLAALAALAMTPAAAAAAPSPIVDADFGGGTADTNTWAVEPGFLRLKPTGPSTNFDGTALPTGWAETAWNEGGAATVAGGALTINGARLNTEPDPTATSGVLEFRATFGNAPFQHVGFGDTFGAPPWAMFSTGDGGGLPTGLHARTGATTTQLHPTIDPTQPTIDPTQPHLYRIAWTPTEVQYFVDGAPAATHTVPAPGPMRPVISDFHTATSDPTTGAAVLKVDWIGMLPYPPSGTFESRVLEADAAGAVWGTLTASPAAGATFETRTGDSPAAMSAYQPVGAAGAIQSPPGKYLQYKATLTTLDPNATPSVDSVSITYAADATAPTTSIGSTDLSGTTAKVTFSSPDADVDRFECSLDGGAFATCTSPKEFTGLGAGSHTVSVRAIDKAGNVGAAASRTFTVAATGGGGLNPPPGGGPGVDTKAPVVSLSSRKLRASISGKVKLKLTCPDDETSCKLTVRLKDGRKTYALTSDTLSGGETSKLTLRLSSKARRKLARHGRLSLKAVVSARDADGNRKKSKYSVTLRPR
jgi:hypothetical protein